jgi:hypothetical protein
MALISRYKEQGYPHERSGIRPAVAFPSFWDSGWHIGEAWDKIG